MVRSIWKVPFSERFFWRSLRRRGSPFAGKVPLVWSSRLVIFQLFVGRRLSLYNGKKFFPVLLKRNMVGLKSGAFRVTKVISGDLKIHGRTKRKGKVRLRRKPG